MGTQSVCWEARGRTRPFYPPSEMPRLNAHVTEAQVVHIVNGSFAQPVMDHSGTEVGRRP